jgi:UDP-N-acetylglucosamine--dolichyl-phosphate N-acetylglucosaminephosphotransferase
MDSIAISIYIISGIIAFVSSIFLTKILIPILKKQRIASPDLNKKGRPLIPEMGGIGVIFAFFMGMNFSLLWRTTMNFSYFEIVLFTIIGLAFIGVLDDLLDLHQLAKSVLPFFIAIPLGIALPDDTLTLPFLGSAYIGMWMILLVPVGITAIVNITNMLEGFNGLGSGLGIIIVTTLIIISFIIGQTDGVYLLIPLLGALLGFFYFNMYPSKIFPGDTMTFFQGAVIGCAVLVANLKTIAVILFIPLIVEFVLKARGRFPAKNHGTITDDGTLTYDGKVFSLSHLLMKYSKVTERRLVIILWTMEAILCAVMILVVYWLGPEYAW